MSIPTIAAAPTSIESAVEQLHAAGDSSISAYLDNERTTNLSSYLLTLTRLMNSPSKLTGVRMLSSLLLKNALTSKNEEEKSTRQEQWIDQIMQSTREEIKSLCMITLKDEKREVRHSVAQVIGVIAEIEIPRSEWNDLISTLSNNVTSSSESNDDTNLKEGSLDALGAVCDTCRSKIVSHWNLILTAIGCTLDATQQSNTNTNLKLAATRCLSNLIPFLTPTTMSSSTECDKIMSFILDAVANVNEELSLAGYLCLIEVAQSHYRFLPRFMAKIFSLTFSAITKASLETQAVAKHAIEFWMTLAEFEIECTEENASDEDRSSHFVKAAAHHLIPALLKCMMMQDEDEEEDDVWSIPMAASTLLSSVSTLASNIVGQLVLPFVAENCRSTDWRAREAAFLAFGCILTDGPDRSVLIQAANQALSVVLAGTKDPHPRVKDSSMWTIGRILSLTPESIEPTSLPSIISAVLVGLTRPPKIASKACWVIHNLARSMEGQEDSTEESTLTPFFTPLIDGLLAALNRSDVEESNLQMGIFESITALINTATESETEYLMTMLSVMVQKLRSSPYDSPIRGHVCSVLSAIVSKFPQEKLIRFSDPIMESLLSTLTTSNHAPTREDAILAIDSVANKLGDEFHRYFVDVMSILIASFTRIGETECHVAVQCMSSIAIALGPRMKPALSDLMSSLLPILTHSRTSTALKSLVVCAIGDLATAVGTEFESSLPSIAPQLILASQMTSSSDDSESADQQETDDISKLREDIMICYSGILRGLGSSASKLIQVPGLFDSILALFDLIASSSESDALTGGVLAAACGLAYDIVTLCSDVATLTRLNQRESLRTLCALAQENEDDQAQHMGGEAMRRIFTQPPLTA